MQFAGTVRVSGFMERKKKAAKRRRIGSKRQQIIGEFDPCRWAAHALMLLVQAQRAAPVQKGYKRAQRGEFAFRRNRSIVRISVTAIARYTLT
jgi:hypothetical protein